MRGGSEGLSRQDGCAMSRPPVHPHRAEPEPMLPPFGPMAAALPTRRANPLLLRKSWHWAFARRPDPSGEGALGHELVERAAVVWAGSGRDDVQRERGGAGIREDSRCKRPRGGEIVAQPFDEAAPVAGQRIDQLGIIDVLDRASAGAPATPPTNSSPGSAATPPAGSGPGAPAPRPTPR
jgi:hypothetical protein